MGFEKAFKAPFRERNMSIRLRSLGLAAALCAACMPVVSAAQTQSEMNATAAADFQKADKALNASYQKLLAKISPKGAAALRQAQRTWIKFRDEDCTFQVMGVAGGSVHPMVYNLCRAELTNRRTKDLRDQLDCEEGDLSCGGQ